MKKTLKLALTSCLLVLAIALVFTACNREPYYTTETIDSFVLELQQLIYDSEDNQESKVNTLRAEYEAKISALESANVTLQGKIDTLITEYEEKVLELEAANNTNASVLATLKSDYEAKVAELTAQDAGNKAALEALEAEYASEVAKLEAGNKANEEALANHKTAYEEKVTELNGLISANTTKISQLETSLAEDIAEIQNAYDAKIASIEALIAELHEAIADLQAKGANSNKKIAVLEEQMNALLSAHEHTFGTWVEYGVGDGAYCSQALYYRICSECRVLEWKSVANEDPAVAHSFTKWFCIKEETCTENGIEQRYCTACAYTETRNITAPGHKYNSTFIPPTATADGYTKYDCENCTDTYKDAYVTPIDCTMTPTKLPWIGYTKQDENIIIPAVFQYGGNWYKVTAIGEFSQNDTLKSITIPNTVTSIDSSAFELCNSLESITIPGSVTRIGWRAFSDCSSLVSVTINYGVKSIGVNAFADCINLTAVTIPDSVTTIDTYAFFNCSNLTNITIPDSVTSIDDFAFCLCSNLTNINLSNNITSIGTQMFSDCGKLENITIPDGVARIGASAFWRCYNLESVTIPQSVTLIDAYAFRDCTALTTISFKGTVAQWNAISLNNTFNWREKVPATKVICSDGIVCFEHVYDITETILPTATTSGYTKHTCSNCGDFYTNPLPTFTITMDNRHLIGYTGEPDENLVIPSVIQQGGIWYEVRAIGGNAFSLCENLTNVTIPASVSSIDIGVFWGSGVLSITYEGTIAQWNAIHFHELWNSTCTITEIVCSDGSFTPPPGHSD